MVDNANVTMSAVNGAKIISVCLDRTFVHALAGRLYPIILKGPSVLEGMDWTLSVIGRTFSNQADTRKGPSISRAWTVPVEVKDLTLSLSI